MNNLRIIEILANEINSINDITYKGFEELKPDLLDYNKILKQITNNPKKIDMYADMLREVLYKLQDNPLYRFDDLKENLANIIETINGVEDSEKIRNLTIEEANDLMKIEPDFFNFKMRYYKSKNGERYVSEEHLKMQQEFKKRLDMIK